METVKLFEKLQFHIGFILTVIFCTVIENCGGEGGHKNILTTTQTPGNVTPTTRKNLDYDAIRDKLSELKFAVLDGLNSIKEDASADKENTLAGRAIVEMINKGQAIVAQLSAIVETQAKEKTLTKTSAKMELRKMEKEIYDLKDKIVEEVQKLGSNTVIKILKKAMDCYHRVLKLVGEISDLLDD